MDTILAEIKKEGTKFGPGDEESWRKLYDPMYSGVPEDVAVIRHESYGPDERNKLDIFFPSAPTKTKPGRAVLLYVHGGGFFSGDKDWSSKVYSNIGYFFAQRDVVVVTMNHRLVPVATYPEGADDVQMAREWIHKNISSLRYGGGSVDKVVLFGHSSGGAHLAMNIYAAGDTRRAPSQAVFPPVAGIMYLSVPFTFDRTKPVRQRVIRSYFGSDAESVWEPLCPLGLFRRLPDDSPLLNSTEIPVYLGSVQYEVKETADAHFAFLNAYRERSTPTGSLPEFHVLPKHNHLSNILSIGTADTSQGDKLMAFIEACTARPETSLVGMKSTL